MSEYIHNRTFTDSAIIYGQPKSGKIMLAVDLVRNIIKHGRDVVWINSEMDEYILSKKIYDGYNLEDNIGHVHIFNVDFQSVDETNVNKLIEYIRENFDMGMVDMIVFNLYTFKRRYDHRLSVRQFLYEFKKNEISVLITCQSGLGNFTSEDLYYVPACGYIIDNESDEISYKNFKLRQLWKVPQEGLFVEKDKK